MYRFLIYRRDPFVLWTLGFIILACIGDLISGVRPGTTEALMPAWYWYTWLVVTLLASVLYVYGIFTRNLFNGLYITWSLCPILATAVSAIGVAQIVVAGPRALIAGAFSLGLGAAFIGQRRLLTKIVRDLPRKPKVKK